MGRCYEFGVAISDGCEHAMVVPATGGRCVCIGCGSSCPGRFPGCEAIISRPGYVPSTAPEWALQVGPRRTPDPDVSSTPRIPTGEVPVERVPEPATATEVRSRVEGDVVVDLIEDLGKQLAARDAELGALFDRFVEEFRRLGTEVADARTATRDLDHRLRALTARVDQMFSATVLGPVSHDS